MSCSGANNLVHRTSNHVVDAASRPAGTAVEGVVSALPDAEADDETGAEDDDATEKVLLDDPLPELHAASTIAATANTPTVHLRFMAVPFLMGVC